MLYHLLFPLSERYHVLNVIRYIPARSIFAFILAFVFVLVLQPRFISWFRNRHLTQPIREDGPQSHQGKKGTPTMGGLVLVSAVVLSALLFARLDVPYVWATIAITISYAALGFVDDYKKLRGKNSKGVSAPAKMAWQIGTAAVVMWLLLNQVPQFTTELYVPFFKEIKFDLGYSFIPFAVFVIVGCSNAVNLTDGLDGLVIGPTMTVACAYGIFLWITGHEPWAAYLHLPYIEDAGEVAIFAAAIFAGGLGFLWFNTFPAQILMGDVGALALGGALGILAVICKQEIVLALAGGVFVLEALSVIIQVASFKLYGKRIFRMAPLHHHYELKGLEEPKIIVRAWIISILLAMLSLLTLKLR